MISDLFRPWRTTATWWALVHVTSDIVIAIVSFVVIIPLLSLTTGLAVVLPAAVVVAWLMFMAARGLAHLERARFAALLDCDLLDAVEPLEADGWWRRMVERVRSAPRWREIAYLVVHLPLAVVNLAVTAAVWCGSAVLVALPFFVGSLPGRTAKFGLFQVGVGLPSVVAAIVGVGGLAVAAPWTTVGLADLDRALGRRLLSTTPKEVYEARVNELESSRVAAVDSAEAERRRIERDLHDGAQQRLISVAIDLGVARDRLVTDPESGRQLVIGAHEELKEALKELRDLVRGIHPVILEDRGLDAALSAVVARAPVPVELRVHVGLRPSPSVESAAYFVVCEALANVARHSRADHAWVTIDRRAEILELAIGDDGIGGADPSAGTGLSGLADRVAALGGTLRLTSPAGGPTTVKVELPCGS